MTFTQIVDEVAARLNLTSSDADTRLGLFVNARNKRLTSSVGLQTSRRSTDIQSTTTDEPSLAFDLVKIEQVYIPSSAENRRVLGQVTYDEWRNLEAVLSPSGVPEDYAIKSQGSASTTIVLHPIPSGVITIYADGLAAATTLSGTTEPVFPADFHDALVYGACADELNRLEKWKPAQEFEGMYERRVSDLRYFLAKSGYLTIAQGKTARIRPWMKGWTGY